MLYDLIHLNKFSCSYRWGCHVMDLVTYKLSPKLAKPVQVTANELLSHSKLQYKIHTVHVECNHYLIQRITRYDLKNERLNFYCSLKLTRDSSWTFSMGCKTPPLDNFTFLSEALGSAQNEVAQDNNYCNLSRWNHYQHFTTNPSYHNLQSTPD